VRAWIGAPIRFLVLDFTFAISDGGHGAGAVKVMFPASVRKTVPRLESIDRQRRMEKQFSCVGRRVGGKECSHP